MPRRPRELLSTLSVAALSAVAAAIVWHPVRESDPFWHLSLGRAVLREGARTVTEPTALPAFTAPCVVPEWLWGIVTLGLHELGGWTLLCLFAALLAGVSAWMVSRLSRRLLPEARAVGWALAALGVAAALARLRLRPQAAFLVLLPWFVERCLAFVAATEARARVRIGLWLVFGTALWAQLHGSFVLAPAIFGAACLALPRSAWREAAATLVGIGAACLTSAHGLGVVHYVTSHGGGEAKGLILDMQPAQWASFDPTTSPFALALAAVWVLALIGLPQLRRATLPHLAWTLLGVLLVANAVRFTAAAAVLGLPMASLGVRALCEKLDRRWVFAVLLPVALVAVGWAGVRTSEERGPLLATGLRAEGHPVRAWAALSALPEGTAVLTSVPAGGPIGFWADGHVRTYVDSRTPLYFDHVDLLVATRIFADPAAFALALERYGVGAVVVRRNESACGFLDGAWPVVALDGAFTTYARPALAEASGLPALRGIQACGGELVLERDCGAAAERAAALEVLRGQAPGPLVDWLGAESLWICGGDPAAALAQAPPASAMWWLEGRRRFLELDAAAARGDTGAVDTLGLDLAEDPRLFPHLARVGQALSPEGLRAVLAAVAEGPLADRARPNLAVLCASAGDTECARLNGTLGALAGSADALRVLDWLAAEHPDPRVRADAAAWRAAIGQAGGR